MVAHSSLYVTYQNNHSTAIFGPCFPCSMISRTPFFTKQCSYLCKVLVILRWNNGVIRIYLNRTFMLNSIENVSWRTKYWVSWYFTVKREFIWAEKSVFYSKIGGSFWTKKSVFYREKGVVLNWKVPPPTHISLTL